MSSLLCRRCLRVPPASPLSSSRAKRSSTLNVPALESDLKARKLPILYDYLTPQPSHLLTTTLVDFLPFLSSILPTSLPSISQPRPLPLGHHLVYFPSPTRPSSLLPDGTDTLHSPGPPFTHRLWAGGHIRFPQENRPLLLDGTRAAIVEGICSVRISGGAAGAAGAGAQKVFVGIERRVGHVREGEGDEDVRARLWWTDDRKEADQADGRRRRRSNGGDSGRDNDPILIERRDLCFLRPHHASSSSSSSSNSSSSSSTKSDDDDDGDDDNTTTETGTGSYQPPPPLPPAEFSHSLTPTPHLLARYSALTYNAHAIHLDPLYTRTRYRQPALLVHGPLLLTLMLTCLQHGLGGDGGRVGSTRVRELSYRCLRPVFVGDEIRVRGRRKGEAGWEVWVEKTGGEPPLLAVRAAVRTEPGPGGSGMVEGRMTGKNLDAV